MAITLDLAKEHLLDLNKISLDVIKKYDLQGFVAEVDLVLDISGSMESFYRKGSVQETADRILALAMNFDDNRSIDVFTFNSGANHVGTLTDENFFGYIDKNITHKVGGGTNYAPVIKRVLAHHGISLGGTSTIQRSKTVKDVEYVTKKGFLNGLLGKKEAIEVDKVVHYTEEVPTAGTSPGALEKPVFVIFITDGDNFDHAETEKVIRQAAHFGVFFKFVGIGNSEFPFLEQLDDMPDRFLDNADFFKVADIAQADETEIYEKLLNEVKDWSIEARKHNLIK